MREISKKKKRGVCKICHKKTFWLSKNRLCKECMFERIKAARYQMKTKEGPVYEKWKKKIIKSLDKL